MTVEQLIVAVAGTVAITLYAIGFVQIKRAFPKRGTWLIIQILLATSGGTAVSAVRGYGPVMWTVAPVCVAVVSFAAGKGSVAVLINQTDDEDGDWTFLPEATVKARRRFGFIATTAVAVFIVGAIAFDPAFGLV